MDVEDLVKSYFRLGFSNKEILCLLAHQHGVIISKRTLQRLCRKLNLFRRKITTSPVLQPGSQRGVALWHIRRRRARRSSTPSGSISLITFLIVSWETTYPLRIARRCNHRPLVAISDCTKEAISSMSVWFFLLNKLSFLHNRCSVLLLIITPCWWRSSVQATPPRLDWQDHLTLDPHWVIWELSTIVSTPVQGKTRRLRLSDWGVLLLDVILNIEVVIYPNIWAAEDRALM